MLAELYNGIHHADVGRRQERAVAVSVESITAHKVHPIGEAGRVGLVIDKIDVAIRTERHRTCSVRQIQARIETRKYESTHRTISLQEDGVKVFDLEHFDAGGVAAPLGVSFYSAETYGTISLETSNISHNSISNN